MCKEKGGFEVKDRKDWVKDNVNKVIVEEFTTSILVFMVIVYLVSLINKGINYFLVLGLMITVFLIYYKLTMRESKYGFLKKGRENFYDYKGDEKIVKLVKVPSEKIEPLKREAFNQGVRIVILMEVLYLINIILIEGVYVRVLYSIVGVIVLGYIGFKLRERYKKRIAHIIEFGNEGREIWLSEEESKGVRRKEEPIKELEREFEEYEQEVKEELEGFKQDKKKQLVKESNNDHNKEEANKDLEEEIRKFKKKVDLEYEKHSKEIEAKKEFVEKKEDKEESKEELDEGSKVKQEVENIKESSGDVFQDLLGMVNSAKANVGKEESQEINKATKIDNENIKWGNKISVQGVKKGSREENDTYGKLSPEQVKRVREERDKKARLKEEYERMVKVNV